MVGFFVGTPDGVCGCATDDVGSGSMFGSSVVWLQLAAADCHPLYIFTSWRPMVIHRLGCVLVVAPGAGCCGFFKV
jgi:hypothetical protein